MPMKRMLTLCLALLVAVGAVAQKHEMPERKAFSNLGVAVSASTTGIGVTLATPIARHFSLRAGYTFSPYSYDYTYDEFDPISVYGQSVPVPDLDLTADLNLNAGHVMVDWVPFKKGKGVFFITGGLILGDGKIIKVHGQFDMSDPNIKKIKDAGLMHELEFEVGEDIIRVNDDGSADAALKVKGLRPYLGLGWGRSIPKHRLGFRFELGAIFQGTPEVSSSNIVLNTKSDELSDFNELLNNLSIYPQLSFQLTYRLFKDK